MNWQLFHGFLVVTFLIHLVVFLIIYQRKRQRHHLLLCGTFLCLFLLYVCKYYNYDVVLGIVTLQSLFRIIAAGFTILVLYRIWKAHCEKVQEVSWVGARSRRVYRRRRKKISSRFGDRNV